jgi:hypothetical protein
VHFIRPSAAPVVPISLSCRGFAFEIPGRSADQRSLLTLAVLVRTWWSSRRIRNERKI